MKSAIFASLIATAAAFAPAKQAASSTALNAFENALGAQPPLGFYVSGQTRRRVVATWSKPICSHMLLLLRILLVWLPTETKKSSTAFDSSN